ncbi:MAG: CHC2 zinc finger domain-containing protein, partial [Treponema sp.]|nr:CHC2 zinc finger domain-containing protein [Treponema sp.]
MAFISQSSIQELTDRLDSITIVSEYARLEKRGGRYWACCPFHQEKTPSFTVNPDMKTFYCFGCQKGGTIINLVMELEKLNFPETVELLAKKTG